MTQELQIHQVKMGGGHPLALIAGPCVVENRDMIMKTAEAVKGAADALSMSVIFKSSYKKANRTSLEGFTGIGMDEALTILDEVKSRFKMPILTDIHTAEEVTAAAQVADVLQIPAFLCRQTDLLVEAGKSGRAVNIKKGQFCAPDDMRHPIEKVRSTGNTRILVTERGASFGYHNLVVDMRSLQVMRGFGCPVVLDATHSVQLPGGEPGRSGGQPEFIFALARAGAAVGIDALFVETHPDPPSALSDAASQLPLAKLKDLLTQVRRIDETVRAFSHTATH
ncbi:MAG: 3-deoxy-8-phosphooctulonate synthase [Acidobacteriota bacterium]